MRIRALGIMLACSFGCAPSFPYPPGPPAPPGTEYVVRLAIDGVLQPDLACAKNPVEIETEPPFYLIDCDPTELALEPDAVVDLCLLHGSSGEQETWLGLSAPRFLRLTQTSVTSSAAGDVFPEWDGHVVTFRGLDVMATSVPGSPYR
jgi:hypothetical protein